MPTCHAVLCSRCSVDLSCVCMRLVAVFHRHESIKPRRVHVCAVFSVCIRWDGSSNEPTVIKMSPAGAPCGRSTLNQSPRIQVNPTKTPYAVGVPVIGNCATQDPTVFPSLEIVPHKIQRLRLYCCMLIMMMRQRHSIGAHFCRPSSHLTSQHMQ